MKNSLPTKAKKAVELATEKGSSNWLTVIPLKELECNLNKKEFRDAMKQWCVSAAGSFSSAITNCATWKQR